MYQSTRDSAIRKTAAQAILQGISAEGGLFVPDMIPKLTEEDFRALRERDYVGRARLILSKFLTDFSAEQIDAVTKKAYTAEKFETAEIAPLQPLGGNTHILELWHGPTSAFKDMALQILPHLMTASMEITESDQTIVILVATSGDTGKAALEGFKDVDRTKILVFYPENGVSAMQKRQMNTQEGRNVAVCAIEGNFDDAQTGVKGIFLNPELNRRLTEKKMQFSSANSINWGRLLPQIVYYVSAYCDLGLEGEPVNFVVPTGNFGNILAAYYAKKMGLPVGKLICASNSNSILTDFIRTGVYDRNREFYTTMSPSMDILISSNLERLIYDMTGCDDKKVAGWMKELSETGRYEVDDGVKAQLKELFYGGYCDEEGTLRTIRETFQTEKYLLDTHTAVAVHVGAAYREETGDQSLAILASTASPYKFADSVLRALDPEYSARWETNPDDFAKIRALSEKTGTMIPAPIASLTEKTTRFDQSCTLDAMQDRVFSMLDL